jgi:hypothetical protein
MGDESVPFFRMDADLDCQTREGRLADKSNQLILEALHRAASEPAGVPLFATKKAPGLFPGGAGARPAAEQCQQMGYLRPARAAGEAFAITDKGLDFLLSQLSPKQVLEGLSQQIEQRQQQVQEITGLARSWLDETSALRDVVSRVLRDLPAQNGKGVGGLGTALQEAWFAEALACLRAWPTTHASGDCPLPELHRHLTRMAPHLSIGSFHDGLRSLHDRQQIYLHPWTGPLYELPEPAFALLIGHEIGYYASSR